MSFGSLLVGGIQDVSAFLPIFGTDQCETHIGAALTEGFLYAATAPLSIFGCLGLVKAALGILAASLEWPLLNAQTLRNAGFELQGPVAAMIGAKDNHYVATSRFLDWIIKENLDHPEKASIQCRYLKWNALLVATALLLSTLSITPYISLMITLKASRESWLYPPIRAVGSLLCAVVSQFLLQCRIEQLFTEARCRAATFSTKGVLPHLHRRLVPMAVYRVLLVAGCVGTAAGYIGCFTVVQSGTLQDTLIWLGLEVFLSLLRKKPYEVFAKQTQSRFQIHLK